MHDEAKAAANSSTGDNDLHDVGVLFVHGIGDHKEGETLTSFGEPTIDWLREWLQAQGPANSRGSVVVERARLRADSTETESPAFATLRITAPSRADGKLSNERWILSEAWWGASVKAPPSLRLIRWLWSRAPLLIFWHVYCRFNQDQPTSDPRFRDAMASVGALCFAAFIQILVAVALVLWLIPFGPWRRAILAVVRTMSLTLGDSYVLLEHDIQRGALVEKVHRALSWLEARACSVIVVAHSQGAAIAHAALKQRRKGKVGMFVSVGSGLEKLRFLHLVRERRSGLWSAALLFPLISTAAVMFFLGAPEDDRVIKIMGWLCVITAILLGAMLIVALGEYRKLMDDASGVNGLEKLGRRRWRDIHATQDLVPMGRGSGLTKHASIIQRAIVNRRSVIYDHIGYFDNKSTFLPYLWKSLSRFSSLRLIHPKGQSRLNALARGHDWHTVTLGLCFWSTLTAGLVFAYTLHNQLADLGASILKIAQTPQAADLFKPIKGFVSLLNWIIETVLPTPWFTQSLVNALLGGVVLLLTLAAWWLVYTGLWSACAAMRWRGACHEISTFHSTRRRIAANAGLTLMMLLACAPLLFALIHLWHPQALSPNALKTVFAYVTGAIAGMFGLLVCWVAPRTTRDIWKEPSEPFAARVQTVIGIFIVGGMLVWLISWLLPDKISAGTSLNAFFLALTAGWLWFAWKEYRQELGWPILIAATVTAIVAGLQYPDMLAIVYLVVMTLLAIGLVTARRQRAAEVWTEWRATRNRKAG